MSLVPGERGLCPSGGLDTECDPDGQHTVQQTLPPEEVQEGGGGLWPGTRSGSTAWARSY